MIFSITLSYNMDLTIELLDELIAQSKQKKYSPLLEYLYMPVISNTSFKNLNRRTKKQIPNINRYFYLKSILVRDKEL